MTPRLTIRAVEAAERAVSLRLPFRFGDTAVERTAEAYARVTVTLDGQREPVQGIAAQLMVPRWFDKRPALSNEDTVEELRDTVRAAAGAAPGRSGTVAELAAGLRDAVRPEGVPRLAAGFGPALLEMALIDAACRALGLSFPDAVRADAFGLSEACPDDLAPEALRRHLSTLSPRWSIALRHTVGFDAPLTPGDVTRRPDDAPVALSEVMAATGARWFKIKLKGDPDADLGRLREVTEVIGDIPGLGVTVDANEQYAPDAFADFAAHLRADPRLAPLVSALAFVEQPYPREIALADDAPPLPQGLRVVIDESDDADDAWPRARARGYAGTSVKSCKGVLRALVNAARIAETGGILTAEDLTCQPGLGWQQDTLMAATVGAAHVERNGHHFAGGMQGAPEAERAAFAAAHPDVYTEGGRLRIAGGEVTFGSLDAPGFASDPGCDFAAMTKITEQEDTRE